MKKSEIILCGIIVSISLIMGNQIYQDNLKIDFLENALATKNLEYEWLKEITDSLLNGSDFNENLESRLQSEIQSNQEMSQMIGDVINVCNEKLEDAYNTTNEKLKKENQVLQKALSKYRNTC